MLAKEGPGAANDSTESVSETDLSTPGTANSPRDRKRKIEFRRGLFRDEYIVIDEYWASSSEKLVGWFSLQIYNSSIARAEIVQDARDNRKAVSWHSRMLRLCIAFEDDWRDLYL